MGLTKFLQFAKLFRENNKLRKAYFRGRASINASEVAGPDNADIIITIADYQDGDVLNTGHQYIVGAAADTKVTVVNAKGETFNNVSIATVPEPTTATLSLPALAVLAARRRRK